MNFKKAIAKVVAVLMISTSIPIFASSANGVNKVITVKEGSRVEKAVAPELGIELKDDLEKGQYFYLDLENAQWEKDVVSEFGSHPHFKFERDSATRLVVEAKKNILASATPHKIPLIAKVTGGQAKVKIISNGTVVTSGEYAFAKAEDTQSIVLAEPNVFASVGEMGTISIEEQYLGAFKSNKTQILTVDIITKGFEFNYNKGQVIHNALKGKRSYEGKQFNAKIIDSTTLEVEIPANSLNASQRGLFELSGIELRATKDATYGDVKVKVGGHFNETIDVVVAKYGDYATELVIADNYEAVAGQPLKNVEIMLAEVIPDSLRGNRETIFTFTEDITIESLSIIDTEGLKVGAPKPVATIIQKKNENSNAFKLEDILAEPIKKTAITFQVTLKVPASFKGNINLIAEGRSLEEKKEATVAKVEAPIEVQVAPITAQVGLAHQEGGKITITETSKGKLLPGKLFLAFSDDIINYTKAPKVDVIQGKINVEAEAAIVDGGLAITINSRSREAATIEISGGEFTVPGLVREGAYKVKVGGPAVSSYSSNIIWNTLKGRFDDIDAITEQDFIYLGTQATSNKAKFIIGETNYLVNDASKVMDTAAYLAKEGRTMLPVRYVADALGIPSNQILWDAKEKAVTILVHKDRLLDKIIRIELGNKEMVINNVKSEMAAAAEMKNNRVFVPIAEIARALGAKVEWDPASQTATFN